MTWKCTCKYLGWAGQLKQAHLSAVVCEVHLREFYADEYKASIVEEQPCGTTRNSIERAFDG